MHIVQSYSAWCPCISEAINVAGWITADFPGIYVLNVEIGNGRDDSMFLDINLQVDSFAATVAADPKLKDGFDLIGHSQGGLITRAYIERYNNPPVFNYFSWAGPHGGQYGTPSFNALCPDDYCPWLNDLMDILYDSWADPWLQSHVAFAAYWKDPFDYSNYLNASHFLADINNERAQKNATYRTNMLSLTSVTLLYSTIDDIVIPLSSPWFQFYKIGQDSVVELFNETQQYQGDWLGLKTLYQAKKLFMYGIPCSHQDIPHDNCKQYYTQYTKPLLGN